MNSVLPSSPPSMQAKAPSINGGRVEHIAALPHAHAALAGNGRDPHRAVGARADAVGRVLKASPDATADEGAVVCHLERRRGVVSSR